MNDIEEVMDNLNEAQKAIRTNNLKSEFDKSFTLEVINQAIQTIRELQNQNKILDPDIEISHFEMVDYKELYLSEVEKNKELKEQNKCLLEDNAELHDDIQSLNVFHQEALEKIPKWHLCKDELPTGEQYRTHNGQFIVANCQKVYAEWFDIYETKLFGEPTVSRFRTDRSVIAWMELPKFESEE